MIMWQNDSRLGSALQWVERVPLWRSGPGVWHVETGSAQFETASPSSFVVVSPGNYKMATTASVTILINQYTLQNTEPVYTKKLR